MIALDQSVQPKPAHRGFERSSALYGRADRSLAGGVSTAFRSFERPVPLFVDSARATELVDVDGNHHVDFADEGGDRRVESYRDHLEADAATCARWAERMLEQGVRVIPADRWYLMAAHTDAHVGEALEAADRAFADL